MRVLAIDYGRARCGLAWSDDERRIALPHSTIDLPSQKVGVKKRDRSWAVVARALAALEDPFDTIVLGLPLRLDGTEGEAARQVRRFGDELLKHVTHVQATLVYWDERLTTVSAERALREMDVRGRDRRRVVDQAAAAILLQSYLDAQTSSTWDDAETPDASERPPRRSRGRGKRGRGR